MNISAAKKSSDEPVIVSQQRVIISTHNPTMRTALRVVALTAPIWAIYIPFQFLGIFGFFIDPLFFDPNSRVVWMVLASATGVGVTALLLLNTLILSKTKVTFPPLKAATLPTDDMTEIGWHWDPIEKEAYVRFWLESGEYIDIHHSRLSPAKITSLKESLSEWAPGCKLKVYAEDLQDLISLRERFLRPGMLSLIDSVRSNKTASINIPYEPHRQFREFLDSLGANEKYFWYCWLTVLLVPCLLKLPDIIWGFIADFRGLPHYQDIPYLLQLFDALVKRVFEEVTFTCGFTGQMYVNSAHFPFVTCILLAVALAALTALLCFACQANRIDLKPRGLELAFEWQRIILFRTTYRWQNMVAFDLDQYGDMVNPEKWRMQIKLEDGGVVNLNIEAIKGAEARAALLRTIRQMAPKAMVDHALIQALMPVQKQSYTELWLQSLSTPPKRSRLAPLSPGQKLKSGRYVVNSQLAVGGQGVAYVATDLNAPAFVLSDSTQVNEMAATIVLKEFVLPVYTSRTVRKHALEKFDNEAAILRELDHPQIVKLEDYFLEDHRAYLVLEHIDGLSLRRLVEEKGALSLSQIHELTLQMCRVLQYLHSLQPVVVHRDFTPDNLILDKNGKLVLIDFNVAQQSQWTTTGTVVGKHSYLPPEQFRGKPTSQSDLYAMGATLFFLSTGEDPEPISCSHPQATNGALTADFDNLVAKLTAIELEDRYQTIEEVQDALSIPRVSFNHEGIEVINLKSKTEEILFSGKGG